MKQPIMVFLVLIAVANTTAPYKTPADVHRHVWFRPPLPECPYTSHDDVVAWTKYIKTIEYYGWHPVTSVTLDGFLIINGGRYAPATLTAEGWVFTRDPYVAFPVEYPCKLYVEPSE
jgi:hypothetical protein